MKSIKIKIALVAALLTSIPSMSAMGRFVVKGLHKPMLQKASSFWGAKKRYTENLLADLQEKAKRGIVPSRKDLAGFDNSCEYNKHWILNSPDEAGHTLFNYVYKCKASIERRIMMNLLKYRGGKFNNVDTKAMEDKDRLKANLNLPLEASDSTTLAALRRFLTKNTEDKLNRRASNIVDAKISPRVMSGKDKKERLERVAEVEQAYAPIETDLLAAAKKERLQKQINKQMPVY